MLAQSHADKCIFAHNPQRADQAPSFVTVGENLFVTQSQDVNYTAFVQAWHNEVKKYDYVSNTCSTVCGHYKQVHLVALSDFCYITVVLMTNAGGLGWFSHGGVWSGQVPCDCWFL